MAGPEFNSCPLEDGPTLSSNESAGNDDAGSAAGQKKTRASCSHGGVGALILKFYLVNHARQVRDQLFHRRLPVAEDFTHAAFRV